MPQSPAVHQLKKVSFFGRPRSASRDGFEVQRLAIPREGANRPTILEPGVEGFARAGWVALIGAWLHRSSGETACTFDVAGVPQASVTTRFTLAIESDTTFAEIRDQCRQQIARAEPRELSEGEPCNVSAYFESIGPAGGQRAKVRTADLEDGMNVGAECAIRIRIFETGAAQVEIVLEFARESFAALEQERASAHFLALWDAFAENPDFPVGAVAVLTDAEEREQLMVFNQTHAHPVPQQTVWELFAEQAEAQPNAIALSERASTRTYRQLALAATRWSATFASTPGQRPVAIWLPRSIEGVECILGAIAAGRPFVPLEAEHPPERIKTIVERSGAEYLVTHSSLVESVAPISCRVIEVDRHACSVSVDTQPTTRVPQLDDLAYLIFTSGSTGEPKGVQITHAGLADYLTWAEREYVRGEKLQYPLLTSLAFDLTITCLFLPLISGGTLHVYPSVAGRPDLLIRQVLEDNAIEVLKVTPSHLQFLLHQDLSGSRIQRIILGGENLTVEAAETLRRRLGDDVEIYNEYGPTEAVVGCMIHRYDPTTDRGRGSVPIGRPADHVQLYVLNSYGQLVPRGVKGELYIGRFGLSPGYHNAPEKTRAAFLENPWKAGETYYRTGDAVRFLTGDCLEYLGRLDRQVKLAGHRVELGEIERSLSDLEAIQNSRVTVKRHTADDVQLVAYYTTRHGDPIEPSELRARLGVQLPHYMVPSCFVHLERFPLTPNGKIDEDALPEPARSETAEDADLLDAPDALTKGLSMAWKAILHRSHLSSEERFFDAGGNSLAAIRLTMAVERDWNRRIGLNLLLSNPTFADFVAAVRNLAEPSPVPTGESSAVGEPREADGPGDELETLPPGFARPQYLIWLEHSLEPESIHYHIHQGWTVADTPLPVIETALLGVLERHSILRTRYPLVEGIPCPTAADPAGWRMERASPDHPDALTEFLNRPFDLATDFSFRALCLHRSEHVLELHVVFHHIAVDAWSLDIFERDLAALLEPDTGAEASLPKLVWSYADYADHRPEGIARSGLVREWWREQLAQVQAVPLEPEIASELPARAQLAAKRVVPLGRSTIEALDDLCRSGGSSRHELLLGLWTLALEHVTGCSPTAIPVPNTDRRHPLTEDLIGCFANLLLCPMPRADGLTLREYLEEGARRSREVENHRQIAYRELQELLPAGTDAQAGRLLPGLFQYLEPVTENPLERAGWRKLDAHEFPPVFDLEGTAQAGRDGAIAIEIRYRPGRVRKVVVEQLESSFQHLLTQLLENPDQPVKELRFLAPVRYTQVTESWARRSRPYPRDASVIELLEAVVREHGQRPALIEDETVLTYKAYHARATALAAHLQSLGVEAGDRVGVCFKRSIEEVVAMTAVLMAGALYVPVDPDAPASALEFQIEDAKLHHILSHRRCVDTWRDSGHPVHYLEELADGASPSTAFVARSATDPAYLMYTSGSTGEPKGSLIPHRGIVRLVRGNDYFEAGPEQTFLHLSSPAFDASTFEIWGALLNGAKLVLFPEAKPSLEDIRDAIETHGVSILWLTAGLFHLVVDECPAILAPLRQVLAGGDVLSPRQVAICRERFPELVMTNGYGPTENTTFSCTFEIPQDYDGSTPVPIGRPIANAEAFILDHALRPVAPGITGELYLGGDGLTLGYWNRPQLNAERLLPHPFSAGADDRIYRSGDLARWREDGTIEFLGRSDGQVKINGYRVELGAIEATASDHPQVQQAVALARTNPSGTRSIELYWVPQTGTTDAHRNLAQHLENTLPPYSRPARIIRVESIPLTPNGKVDRRALADSSHPSQEPECPARPSNAEESDADTDALQWQLQAIWSRVLDRRVFPEDDFFAIGGNSLNALRLLHALQTAFGAKLTFSDLVEAPTVRAMAARVGRTVRGHYSAQIIVPLQPGATGQPLFWMPAGIAIGGGYYLVQLAREIDPSCNLAALEYPGHERRSRDLPQSVEAIARVYQREIRRIFPSGPYHLAGNCFGAQVAFETARQLEAAGETVETLILANSEARPIRNQLQGRPSRRHESEFLRRLKRMFILLRDNDVAQFYDRLKFNLGTIRYALLPHDDRLLSPLMQNIQSKALASVAQESYFPAGPVRCQIDLLLSEFGIAPDAASRWEPLTESGVSVHPIPGQNTHLLSDGPRQAVATKVHELLHRSSRS